MLIHTTSSKVNSYKIGQQEHSKIAYFHETEGIVSIESAFTNVLFHHLAARRISFTNGKKRQLQTSHRHTKI